MKNSSNPFLQKLPYILGFVFSIIFGIMLVSSMITQRQIGAINVDEITQTVETQCLEVCDASPLPQVDIDLCKKTCSDSVETSRRLTSERINQEIGFFTGLFFNPPIVQWVLTIIVLFIIGFLFGWGINSIIMLIKK